MTGGQSEWKRFIKKERLRERERERERELQNNNLIQTDRQMDKVSEKDIFRKKGWEIFRDR